MASFVPAHVVARTVLRAIQSMDLAYVQQDGRKDYILIKYLDF